MTHDSQVTAQQFLCFTEKFSYLGACLKVSLGYKKKKLQLLYKLYWISFLSPPLNVVYSYKIFSVS